MRYYYLTYKCDHRYRLLIRKEGLKSWRWSKGSWVKHLGIWPVPQEWQVQKISKAEALLMIVAPTSSR